MLKNILNAVLYILLFMVLQIGIQIILVIYAQFTGADTYRFIENNVLLSTLLSNLVVFVVLVIFFRLRTKRLLLETKMTAVSIKTYIIPIVCAISYSMCSSLILYDVEFSNSLSILKSADYYSSWIAGSGGLITVLTVLISAPVVEEIIFRGLVITRLKRLIHPALAITISALLFGAVHVMAGGVLLFISSAIAGAIFGIIFEKTQSLLPVIAAHLTANLPDFLLNVLPEITNYHGIVIICCFGALLVFSLIRLLK